MVLSGRYACPTHESDLELISYSDGWIGAKLYADLVCQHVFLLRLIGRLTPLMEQLLEELCTRMTVTTPHPSIRAFPMFQR